MLWGKDCHLGLSKETHISATFFGNLFAAGLDMKNRLFRNPLFFILASLLLSFTAQSQVVVIRIGSHPGNTALNNWSPGQANSGTSIASEAPRYVEEIMGTLGLKPNFEVRAARVDNAAAVVYGGKRYILYNPGFVDALVRRTGNKWAAVSVLAHEIGHHLDGHTLASAVSQPQLELEADEFSGYVLRKMGASLTDAQAAMSALASEAASRTHPGRSDRLVSIAKGWNKGTSPTGSTAIAREMNTSSFPIPVASRNSPVAASRSSTVLPEQYILGDLSFHSDPEAQYFVTTRYNVVKVSNNRIYILGKMTRMNNSSFPYMINDAQSTRLYVRADGRILSETGRVVGRLKVHEA
jgi:hypothetical protein